MDGIICESKTLLVGGGQLGKPRGMNWMGDHLLVAGGSKNR